MFINVVRHILSCIISDGPREDGLWERIMSFSHVSDRDGRTAGAKTLEERKLGMMLKKARSRGIAAPPLFTCDPQCTEERGRLEGHLTKDVEPELRDQAAAAQAEGHEYKFIVVLIDKARQNAINNIVGQEGGDCAMEGYWDVSAKATADVAAMNGSQRVGISLTGVRKGSDENINTIGGIQLSYDTHAQFRVAWDAGRAELDLGGYRFTMHTVQGELEASLRGFSRVLRNPGMVVACNFKISEPIVLRPDEKQGFILERVRELENSEAEHFERLPRIYTGNGGLAGVRTPFRTNLEMLGKTKMESGTFVEIKLGMSEEHAGAFRGFIQDKRDAEGRLIEKGTRKCYSEVGSGRAGIRFFNTFFGKGRSDEILTPITLAMDDLRRRGVDVLPVTNGYLQYWVDAPNTSETVALVERALARRINSVATPDHGYLDMEFLPSVISVGADSTNLRDLRAMLILKSLEKEGYPAEALGRTDFLVNFLDHINIEIQRDVLSPFNSQGMANMVRWVCSARRGIRDTEDLIWTLRSDRTLPKEIQSAAAAIEKWVFDFAMESYGQAYHRLATIIQRESH